MTDYIELNNLNMNHFTILDAELYCQISGINPDNIKYLFLGNNSLTDISGVSIFKNLEDLTLFKNSITDINDLKNLISLKFLNISNLNFIDEIQTVKILKTLNNLKYLHCINTFKKINIKKEFKRRIHVFD